jgi:hypothetical protein
MAASYFDVLLDSAEGRPKRALETALAALRRAEVAGTDADFFLMTRAFRVARALGRTKELADVWATRFAGEKPRLTDSESNPAIAFAMLCTYASREHAQRCLARVEEEYPQLRLASINHYMEGARELVQGHTAKAIRAWRTALAEPTMRLYVPPEPFEEAGERRLVALIDTSTKEANAHGVIEGLGIETCAKPGPSRGPERRRRPQRRPERSSKRGDRWMPRSRPYRS